jgi:NADH-quinone oxidoreductase subunit L
MAACFDWCFITAAYTARMMILTFWGESKTPVSHQPGRLLTIPLVVLAFFALFAGFIELPHNFGHLTLFSDLLHPVLPQTVLKATESPEWLFQVIAAIATLGGIGLAYFFYYRQPQRLIRLKASGTFNNLYNFWHSGWKFDKLYDLLIVNPIVYIARINKNDVVDKLYSGITGVLATLYRGLSYTQSGSLRWYIMGLIVGAIVILTMQIML